MACASKPAPVAKPIPAVTPGDIWKYINEDQPYQNWSTFPPERVPADAVWKDDYINLWIEGEVAKIYMNSTALSAIDKAPRDLPYGSIIIAEVYPIKEDETLAECTEIAGFYKVEGSTALYNDWVSFAYAPDGSVPLLPDGRVMDAVYGPVFGTKTFCHSCHEAAENDFIWIDSPKYDVEHTQMPAPVAKPIPAVTPGDIWNYINEDQPYQDWSPFPPERVPADAVWKDDYHNTHLEGTVAKTYVNSTALSAIDKAPRDLPYGSIIVAEYYPIKEDGTLAECTAIAGFYKVEGSTAQHNDWVSFAYTPDGSVRDVDYGPVFGTKTFCHSCHEAAENDYIWIDSPKYDVEHTQMPSPEKQ